MAQYWSWWVQLLVIFITVILSFLLVIYWEPTSAWDCWIFPTLKRELAKHHNFTRWPPFQNITLCMSREDLLKLLHYCSNVGIFISKKYLAQELNFTCKATVSYFNSPFLPFPLLRVKIKHGKAQPVFFFFFLTVHYYPFTEN